MRTLLAVSAVLVLAAGLWILMGPGGGDPGQPEGPLPGAPEADCPGKDAAPEAPAPAEAGTVPANASASRLLRPARLSGRVTAGEDGSALPGVIVIAGGLPHRDGPRGAATATTDAAGKYELADLRPGDWMVFVACADRASPGLAASSERGYNPLAVTLEPGEDRALDLETELAARAVGRVLDAAGEPVAGAGLRAFPARSAPEAVRRWRPNAVSGRDGRYEIRGLVPGLPYQVGVAAPGHPNVYSAPRAGAAGGTVEIDFDLPPVAWVAVRVLEEGTRVPIAGAVVGFRIDGEDTRERFETDEDGAVRAGPLAAGALEAVVTINDYVDPAPLLVPGSEEGKLELELTVTVPGGPGLSGRLIAPPGALEADRKIRVLRMGAASLEHPLMEWVRAGDDGRFRLHGLPKGPYHLEADLMVGSARWIAQARAEAGEAGLVLEMKKRISIGADRAEVRVLDPAGRPAASARWSTDQCFRGARSGSYGALEDGRISTERIYSGGTIWIRLRGARDVDGRRLGALIHGPVRDLPTSLALAGEQTIAGTVRDAEGKPVRGIHVSAMPIHSEFPRELQHPDAFARSDVDGSFRLGGLGSTDYDVRVTAPGRYARRPPVRVAAGTGDLEIRLRDSVTATLRVLDWTGKPVPECRVVATGAGTFEEETGADGVARVSGLDPEARYKLQVQYPVGRWDLLPYGVSDWRPADGMVRFARAFTVRGVVRDASGKPMKRAFVRHRHDDGKWCLTMVERDGTFVVMEPTARPFTLFACAELDPDAGARSETITVSADTEGVEFRLPAR